MDQRVRFLSLVLISLFAPTPSSALLNVKTNVPRPHTTGPVTKTALSAISDDNGGTYNLPMRRSHWWWLDRRQLLIASGGLLLSPQKALAGLVQFPVNDPRDLLNTYHFLRVGDTLLEEEDIWSTNPLFLTNREAALSPTGQEQIQAACAQMEKANQTPGVVKYSLAASCIDASNIVGDTLDLGRDRIIPEFTFLDPRGIGKWEMLSYSKTRPAVWALDVLEAGPNGMGGRPPANEDGTPNETLADQAVRLRQVMSILETLYSGETILLIFPDSTGPALLSAMIAGIPLNRVHELEFSPGELRMDVTKASVLQLWKEREANIFKAYEETLVAGRSELIKLRKDTNIVNLKDQKLEAERVAIDKVYNEKEAERLEQEEDARESRLERQAAMKQEAETKKQARLEQQAQERQSAAKRVDRVGVIPEKQPAVADGDLPAAPMLAVAAAGLVGVAGVLSSPGSGPEKTAEKRSTTTPEPSMKVPSKDAESSEQMVMTADATVEEKMVIAVKEPMDPVDLLEGESPEPPSKPVDRFEAAEKAMEEYLDKDDGAEDWLSVMSELIEEEDMVEDEEIVDDKASELKENTK